MARLKSLFKWSAIAAGGLLSLALLWFAFINWRAGVCLDEQLQALRQAGQPLSLADLAPSVVSPERDALTYLRRAEKSVMALDKELSPLGRKYDNYYEGGRLNQRGQDAVEAALGAYPDAIPLIERAADAPDYVPDHDFTLAPQPFLDAYLEKAPQARAFARLLARRGDLLLARGEPQKALLNGLTLLRLDQHFEREPMLIAYLVSVAIRGMGIDQVANALAEGSLPSELHDQVTTEISRQLASRAFIAALSSERAYGIDYFRSLKGLGLPGYFKRDECDYLKRMAAEIKIGAMPRYKAEAALAQMDADTRGAGVLTLNVLPALKVAREAQLRSRTRLQCLTVLNALARRGQPSDRPPPTFDELKLPDDIKLDPYNGQPLKIKATKGCWLVYSVGPNLKDDGGKIEKSEDIGVGPDG